MSQQQQEEQMLTPMKAVYPAPPPFYKNFTKQNVEELRRLRKDAGVSASGPSSSDAQTNGDHASGGKSKDIDITSLPPELRYLIPPQLPADGTFTIFGEAKSLEPKDPTLADLGIEQLYPDHPDVYRNPQPHLIALARSLLTKYLHILGVLSENPEEYEQSTKDLEAIVYNMHDLINKYRPHQARESLILMMEERVEKLREEVRGIDEGEKKARELMQGFERDAEGFRLASGQEMGLEGTSGKSEGAGGRMKARQERAWAALHAELPAGLKTEMAEG